MITRAVSHAACHAQDPDALPAPPRQAVKVIAEVDEAIQALDDGFDVYTHRKADDDPVPTLMTVKDKELSLRESAWHEFIVPEEVSLREMKVVVVFKGVFQQRGYVLGRLAAALSTWCVLVRVVTDGEAASRRALVLLARVSSQWRAERTAAAWRAWSRLAWRRGAERERARAADRSVRQARHGGHP